MTNHPIVIVFAVTTLVFLQGFCFLLGFSIGRMLERRKANRKLKALETELADIKKETLDLQDFRNRVCETYKNEPN
ncbi:MAG: hypothetical protein BV458_12250 [Thermoplasmata archaeon M9B2D]|nr:MAG: hypothetical protein BV458_12250 [Thermoplasmata archaeon M9B2D]